LHGEKIEEKSVFVGMLVENVVDKELGSGIESLYSVLE